MAGAVRLAAAARAGLPFEALRLVDGLGDSLPRLVVERFGDATWIRGAPSRADDLPAILAGLDQPPAAFWRFGHAHRGAPAGDPGERVVREGSLRFAVHLGENRNPGLFLDGRSARAWVQANSGDRAVLNLFSYTCGFGVAAAAGGARLTTNVDTSAGVLARGRANYALNGLPADGRTFWKRDAMKALRQLRSAGARFDGIVVDPPPVRQGAAGDPVAYLGRVCRLARQLLAPGGWVLALCAARGVTRAAVDAAVGLGEPVWCAPPAPDFRAPGPGPRLVAAAYSSVAPTSGRSAAGPAGST